MSFVPITEAPKWGEYYDGLRALQQRSRLRVEGDMLIIDPPEGEVVRWPIADIRRIPDQAPGRAIAYGLSLEDPSRLIVSHPESKKLLAESGEHLDASLKGPSLWPRASVVVGSGAAIMAALFYLILPALAALLANFMNVEAEVAMGEEQFEATRYMFGGGLEPLRICDEPAGVAALDKMLIRVADGVELPYELHVVVLDDSANPAINAYAVAGGRMTFFNALIQAAETPEEVAAVLAHELGHVVNDDPVRGSLQRATTTAIVSILAGDISGGGLVTGALGGALTSSYSRGAETRADEFAYDQLTKVGLPPSAMGEMFTRMREEYGDAEGLVAHFSSHPQLTARIEAAAERGDPVSGAPALTPEEWQALQGICG